MIVAWFLTMTMFSIILQPYTSKPHEQNVVLKENYKKGVTKNKLKKLIFLSSFSE